jgi:hypothetical protein
MTVEYAVAVTNTLSIVPNRPPLNPDLKLKINKMEHNKCFLCNTQLKPNTLLGFFHIWKASRALIVFIVQTSDGVSTPMYLDVCLRDYFAANKNIVVYRQLIRSKMEALGWIK